MKYTLIVLALLTSRVFAQLPILTDDQFDQHNPSWAWSDADDVNNYRKTRNGVLYAEHRGPQIYWTLRPSGLNPRKDFRIEAKFRAVEPMTKGMYHVIMRGADELYLYFGINTETKQYWLGTEQKGNWMTYRNGTDTNPTCEGVKTGLADNVLVIQNTGNLMHFSVNGVEINEMLDIQVKTPALWTSIYNVGIATNAPMKTETDYYRIYQDNAINLISTKTFNIVKETLGPEVNSNQIEKWPVVSPDGNTLYFIRNSDPSVIKQYGTTDDIFFSSLDEKGNWTTAQPMPSPINNNSHNALMTITPDNNTLLLMHQYNADGSYKASGFSVSYRTKKGWTLPADIPMKNYYNEAGANEFCLSSDQQIMVMSVRRKDTFGENDIYVSIMQPDGIYSEPKNMGPVINTFGGEVTPFLAADTKTLYFSSNGHPGYGDNDIFVSRRLDDTWTNWSKPQNLGASINSTGWEAYFTIPASGTYAYMIGGADIVRMKLPEEFRPEPVIIVSGRVLDSKTKKPLEASIQYAALAGSSLVGKATSSPVDGSYKISLPSGTQWGFRGEKEEYYAVSENLDLTQVKEYEEVTKDLYLTPIEKGQVVRLNNIFFDFNKSDLKPESFPELDRLMKMLQDNGSMVIEISGHTDNVGDDAYNLKLSQTRSEAVMKYLQSKGIAVARVSAKGYGEGKPVAVNTTDAGRAENRRVEFVIVKL